MLSETKHQDILNTFVEEIGGADALNIIERLSEEQEITDEEIAAETELRLNVVRKILYKLYDNQLAAYRRTRDQNTGWFVYYWKLVPNRVKELLLRRKKQVLKVLEDRLSYERTNMFFECSTPTCPRCTFNQAVENSFRCPTCGKILNHQQNEQIVTKLEEKLEKLKLAIENGTS
jgi:transcription initiation factor TFIIE subunit alpha